MMLLLSQNLYVMSSSGAADPTSGHDQAARCEIDINVVQSYECNDGLETVDN